MIKLLIADDEEIIRNGLKSLIEDSGLNVEVCCLAEDGEDAFKKILKYKPEIVLMDINMPLLNGLESIAKMREINKTTKIIIVSGYSEFKYAQKALELGVFAYILKPVDYKKLLETINKAAENYDEYFNKKLQSFGEFDSSKSSAIEAINYINENYTSNEISLTQVSQIFHMGQSNLTKIIKQKTGYSFNEYLNKLRMDFALKLLKSKDNDYNIAQISQMSGYSSQHYFSRAFKNHFGTSPNKYKC